MGRQTVTASFRDLASRFVQRDESAAAPDKPLVPRFAPVEGEEEMVEANARLVPWVVHVMLRKRWWWHYDIFDYDDLIAVGNIGLLNAVRGFRPDRGFKFSTYAIRCIFNLIVSRIFDYCRRRKRWRGRVASLDRLLYEEGETALLDVLCDRDRTLDHTIEHEIELLVQGELSKMGLREASVMRLRWQQEKTLEEIGAIYGVTRERIRQIEAKVCQRLRRALQRHRVLPA